MTTTGKVLTALAIGGAAGAILGILYAPDKGSETRKKFINQGKSAFNGIKNKISETKGSVSELKEGIAKAIMEKVEELTYAVSNGVK